MDIFLVVGPFSVFLWPLSSTHVPYSFLTVSEDWNLSSHSAHHYNPGPWLSHQPCAGVAQWRT